MEDYLFCIETIWILYVSNILVICFKEHIKTILKPINCFLNFLKDKKTVATDKYRISHMKNTIFYNFSNKSETIHMSYIIFYYTIFTRILRYYSISRFLCYFI